MKIGTQIVSPFGLQQMVQGQPYHFLKSHAASGRVFLVLFEGVENITPRAHIFSINRFTFEDAVIDGLIVPEPVQALLPPWLEQLDGVDLAMIDTCRPNAKYTHRSRVENRILLIATAIRDLDAILSTEDPTSEINRYARQCTPKQNETRFRTWLLTYLCFGRNQWVLLPPFHRIGHWDRLNNSGNKLGRHSISHGPGYGYSCDAEMIEKIIKGYLKYSDNGVKLTSIYDQTMTNIFKCKVITTNNGMKKLIQPEGIPFPSFYQFYYRVHKEFGIESVQKTLYGEVRHRAKLAASKGRFSEAVANLMERIEADGYYTKDRPVGYLEGSSLPSICVVRCRDLLSGMILGIGFSLDKERSTAYRMMLFSMAVPKDYFCSLFAVDIDVATWPSEGLPPYFGVDRGPGAKSDLIADFEKRFPIRELAPSNSGQSKATVESSHPRSTKLEGEPNYIQSNLTPIEMARREIYRVKNYNESADMSDRIGPDPELAYLPPNPISIWNYYDARYRTDAQPMSIDDAVRTFLTPIELVVKKNGVWLNEQRYDSTELRATGLLDKVARSLSIKLSGYMLDMCVRHIWLDLEGRLLQLDAKLRIRDDDEKLYVSFAELQQWSEARRSVKSEFREHQRAANADYLQKFEEATDKSLFSPQRKSGRPKRNASAEQEARQYGASSTKRKK